ncbi:MAG: ExeM/NucH family extracellular endonuclease, partial [Luteimonas sp.]
TVRGHPRPCSDGALAVGFEALLYAPTERAWPGRAAAVVADDNARRRLRLQLAPSRPDAAHGPVHASWRGGSVLEAVEGVVAVDASGPLLAVDRPVRARPAPRPAVPEVGGDLRIASLNLQNLFNGDGRGGGFPTARGARTQAGYLEQRGKLVAMLQALDADIVALMELENDGEGADASLAQLVAALNADSGIWRFVSACSTPCDPVAALGAHPIRVGLVYRADRVVPVGAAATLAGGPFGERSRTPLAQAFRAGQGPVFTVVAVHMKSKGCSEAGAADRDQGDGQACWNATRLQSAQRLDAWLRTDPTRSGSDLVAIVGDFNAYGSEDPIRHLLDAGWQDGLARASAPYTYVFDAQAGRLDHALLSPALSQRLAGAAIWHANADEAPNSADVGPKFGELPPTPWRSSDHDPLLVGLRLRAP